MLQAIRYARERKVPYFGICLGMQTMVIEYARNVCGLAQADSTEFDNATPHRVIYKLRELKGVDELGGTMRLGAYPCALAEGSNARAAYGKARDQRAAPPPVRIQPRLREGADRRRAAPHRPDAGRRLCRDLRDRGPPWYLGCQFHPEFKSKPLDPHPLFSAFVGAAYQERLRRTGTSAELLSHAN
jgi:CTP synthase